MKSTLLDSGAPAQLNPQHWHMLSVESAITPEVITERGYRSLDHPDDLRDLGFSRPQARTAPALAIPLWDVLGHQSGWQIRPDSPRLVGEKLAKYETPTGGRLTLDVHPKIQALLGDPTVPLWITEGVKKGDALVSQGACTIALMGGVWGFKGTNEHKGKVILPDWQHVALNGRTVRVVFDSDIYYKSEVEKALKALYVFLRGKAARPALVRWPEAYRDRKMGVDDYFAEGHTLDDLLQMIPEQGPLPVSPPSSRNGSTPVPIQMILAKNQKPCQILANVLKVLEQHPAWKDALGFDELLNDVVFFQRPPYLGGADPWTARPVTENDYNEFSAWLQNTYDLHVGKTLAGDGLTTYAFRFPFHAIREYLSRLVWDGVQRLDAWLTTYCQVPFSRYTRAVGCKTLVGGVARVYQPGCKVDTMTILEGEQGIGKSTVWNVLAGEAWFTDWLPDLHDKDAAQTLCGKWFIEFGELSAFQRSEVEIVKRFISAKVDHYRPSYGRKAQTFPRQNIFVASTNADHYFKDPTGNRRFWPVKLPGLCDIEGLRRDRDQLWAEAVVRYLQQERWYMTPEEERFATHEQRQRMELDDWEAPILHFVRTDLTVKANGYVTTEYLHTDLFKVENKALWTTANTRRMGAILRSNGWKHQTVRDADGHPLKAFVPIPAKRVVTAVTDTADTSQPIGYSISHNKNNNVTAVTAVTEQIIYRDDRHPQPSLELAVTAVTAVTDSPATNGSSLGARHSLPPTVGESEQVGAGVSIHCKKAPDGKHVREPDGKAWRCGLCLMRMTPPLATAKGG